MTPSIKLRVGQAALAAVLAAACSGCLGAAAIANVAPVALTGTAQVVSITTSQKGVSKEDQSERCEQLLTAAPGVEELRKTKDGIIETRQWKLVPQGDTATWMLAREKSAPEDAWLPKPNIAKLNFNPSLYDLLQPDRPQFLAYARSDVVNPADTDQLASMTSTFGAGSGTFQWRGRPFSFVMVRDLPCFKSAH